MSHVKPNENQHVTNSATYYRVPLYNAHDGVKAKRKCVLSLCVKLKVQAEKYLAILNLECVLVCVFVCVGGTALQK